MRERYTVQAQVSKSTRQRYDIFIQSGFTKPSGPHPDAQVVARGDDMTRACHRLRERLMPASLLVTLVLMLGISRPGAAQTVSRPFADLGRYLDPGDTVFVTGRETGETRGRLVRVSPNAVVVIVEGQEREFPSTEIGWIEKRGDSVWNGVLIGAFVLGLPFAGGAGASCSPNCGAAVTGAALGGAAIGAGVGALIDSLHQGRTQLYGTRPESAHSFHRQGPVETVPELWSRLRPGDTVSVRETKGEEVVGTFARTSESSITVVVEGRPREIPANAVRRVQRRGSQLGRGLLLGPPIGAAIFVSSALAGGASPGEVVFSAAGGALGGLVWGAIVGRLLPQRRVVFTGTAPAVRVTPVLAPGRSGAMLSVQF